MKEQQPASKASVAVTADGSWMTQAGEPREPRFPVGGGSSEKAFLPEIRPDWSSEWEFQEDAFLF